MNVAQIVNILPEGATVNKISRNSQNYHQNIILNEQVPAGAIHVGEILGHSKIHPNATHFTGILTNEAKNFKPGSQGNSVMDTLSSDGNILGFIGGEQALQKVLKMPVAGFAPLATQSAHSSSTDNNNNSADSVGFAGQAIAELGNGNPPRTILIDVENNATLNVTNLVVEEGNCNRSGMRVRGKATSYGPTNIDVTATVKPAMETVGQSIDGDYVNNSKCCVNLTVRGKR